MEPEEEFAKQFLFINDLSVDRFNHDRQHRRMFETEILELHFSLSYEKKEGIREEFRYLLNEKSFL